MSRAGDSRRGKRPIDAAAKVAFLAALGGGAPRREAAAAGGYALNSFHRAARGDSVFRAGWDAARALAAAVAAAEWRAPAAGEPTGGAVRLTSNNRRLLQRRKMRHVRFDEARRRGFLGHFAWSCDVIAAAAYAGVSERTVYVHRRRDPDFAEAFQAALEKGFAVLEAEMVRERLAAQQRLRQAIDEAEPPEGLAEREAVEFERGLKLLARWDRRGGRIGPREVRYGRLRTSSFDEAVEALDRKLRALGVRRAATNEPREPAQ